MAAGTLAACGSDDGGAQTLTWYINPDAGGQAEIASRCTEEAGGAYRIETAQLPRESSQQREQLIRRLAAEDSSIDLISLDPPYIPEFAEAGFLAPVPEDVAERVTEDVVQSAIDGSTWNDEIVAIPFWANTQLLWYKQSVAEAAGLDMEEPVTWQQLVEAAEAQDTQIAAQGIRAEALTVWVNALIESAGGSIIEETAEDPGDIELGLTSDAAVEAAEVMQNVSTVGGPAFSTAGEDANVTDFEDGDAAFMVNWPFVWGRALGAVEAGTLDASVPEDYGWALYPRTVEGEPSAPPYGGINLGIGAFSENVDAAFEAAECIVSEENQAYYFISNGNPASKASVYDDPEVLEVFPQAPLIRESLEMAAPRPQTVYYSEVSGALQRVYHPASSVEPGETGEEASELILAVLRGEELL
ncbi:carbohydrate ABC transporter substrate-binding protein (CUT1 family) [Blastococcus colisei]|uniref:Carbohydrate ABC transporter substrate-binding protein (CUT1 family) n=1 Tax=Blastococcus colisei TaxID=1564162 RepID=A0A543PH43_9ACTN|nr:extracellular solute-binding protein [Blastococcus colisei]TQN43398.1 carbohydrate ABC transporter substrate-binding protein (CUT1 family) [Blastococcus colisei]